VVFDNWILNGLMFRQILCKTDMCVVLQICYVNEATSERMQAGVRLGAHRKSECVGVRTQRLEAVRRASPWNQSTRFASASPCVRHVTN
jgi:hypothetical protein